MSQPDRPRRTAAATLAVAAMIGGSLSVVAATPAAAAPTKSSSLGKHDRQLLAQARAERTSTVTLLLAAKRGSNKAVANAVAALGGEVRHRDDDVSYLRVTVPIDRAEEAANLPGVQAADLDEVIPLEDPRQGLDGSQPPTKQVPPGRTTSRDNPYMPVQDIGASAWRDAHPTWDGRGTRVAVVDTGVDLAHPALSRTTTGERKITDWVTATHFSDDGDPTWVRMADQVAGRTVTYKGVSYTTPAAGSYRIGLFDERDPRLGGEVGNDVDRDGNPEGSTGVFAVLWDTTTNDVYVDTDRDSSFADEKAMTDYRVRYDVGTLGEDDPATDVRESMPFVVQTDGKNKYVNLGIVSGAHGSHVAGIVAANGMFGGAMTGAAPGAQLTSVRVCLFVSGCTAHALIEGMTWVAKQGDVDVINMSIGGLPALNDGNNTRAVLYDRLIEQYKVQMFISAGNSGAGLNTIGDPSVASKAVSVGSYITDRTWRSNYGSDSASVHNLHPFSSRGPREDGGFKPQIVAPGSAVSTVPTWQPGGPVAGTYELPAGYAMFNGTSMASPQAAGGAALLVSAGKQTGVQHRPAQLRQAIASSAHYLPHFTAADQGNGLMDVPAAWEVLKRTVKPVEILASVPVRTALSGFLATADRGTGIYDREGVTAGKTYTRDYVFTRTSGGGGAVDYQLSWVGNDGTFTAPAKVRLPLNTPTTVTVSYTATTGLHSAVLNLDDPATPGVDAQTMNTVVAADRFTVGDDYSVTKTGTIGRNQATSFFFDVPAGTPAFTVDFTGPTSAAGTGQARFLRFHPYGVGVDSSSSLACYAPVVSAGCQPGSRTAANPQAGVWEVVVEGRRTSDVADAEYALTATVLGARVAPDPDVIPAATVGTPVERSYTLENLYGSFTGRVQGTVLGSALQEQKTIGHLAQQRFTVTVGAGSTSLTARIGNPSDPQADLDLFVYRGSTLLGQSADGDSEESVTLRAPAEGTYTVVVDGYAVPAGTTKYDYLDVFTDPALGAIDVTDPDALRAAGSSWDVRAEVTARAVPATGRVLLGSVQVRTDGDVLVGSGEVVVKAVTP